MPWTFLFSGLLACSSPTYTGRVVDVTGAPIAGAAVTAVGSLCLTEADAQGMFALSCSGDDLRLAVMQDGYFSHELDVEGGSRDLGATVLYRIPPGEGLFLFHGADYVPLRPALARMELERRGHARAWYLDEDGSEPMRVSAGVARLFEANSYDWRMFRIADDGLIYREVRPGPEQPYAPETAERIEPGKTPLERNRQVVGLQLEPGRYFIAEWTHGRFEKKTDSPRYRGHLLVAE